MALPLQNIEHTAGQVDAGVVPVAEQAARQIVDGVDHRGGVGKDALFDADHLVAGFDVQIMGQLIPRPDGKHLNAVGMGVAAKAADQRVIFQFLVQTAAQAQHRTVHHRADAAHPLYIACTLHFAQSVPDHGAAYSQFGGKIHLCRQTVCMGIAPGAQFVQQAGDHPVADHSTAQSAGGGKSRFLHFGSSVHRRAGRRDFKRPCRPHDALPQSPLLLL